MKDQKCNSQLSPAIAHFLNTEIQASKETNVSMTAGVNRAYYFLHFVLQAFYL